MEAVRADSQVEIKPARNKMYQDVTVKSTLTLRAEGGDLQYVAMRLPTKGSRRGTFEVLELATETGEALAWVGMNANLDGTNNADSMSVMDVNASTKPLRTAFKAMRRTRSTLQKSTLQACPSTKQRPVLVTPAMSLLKWTCLAK